MGLPTFQRVMERVLSDLLVSNSSPVCRVFFDDVLVASASLEEHLDLLRRVFVRLREANLKLKVPKCRFLRKETEYLRYQITGDGVATCLDKVAKSRTGHSLRVHLR